MAAQLPTSHDDFKNCTPLNDFEYLRWTYRLFVFEILLVVLPMDIAICLLHLYKSSRFHRYISGRSRDLTVDLLSGYYFVAASLLKNLSYKSQHLFPLLNGSIKTSTQLGIVYVGARVSRGFRGLRRRGIPNEAIMLSKSVSGGVRLI